MKNRIQYIDCLRGFTMILVVYSHVIGYAYLIDKNSFMNCYFMQFRMPLFFFVSGFLAYSFLDKAKYFKKLKRRLLGQFFPTCVMLLLFDKYSQSNIASSLLDTYKNGYWFTLVVFELFLFIPLSIIVWT